MHQDGLQNFYFLRWFLKPPHYIKNSIHPSKFRWNFRDFFRVPFTPRFFQMPFIGEESRDNYEIFPLTNQKGLAFFFNFSLFCNNFFTPNSLSFSSHWSCTLDFHCFSLAFSLPLPPNFSILISFWLFVLSVCVLFFILFYLFIMVILGTYSMKTGGKREQEEREREVFFY